MDTDAKEFNAKLEERFDQLPKVVQDAITSADVEKHLRELAGTHKLHLDQWEKLENEVMLALLGFQRVDDLQENIKKEVGVDESTASELAQNISKVVFGPIREELEQQLSHPGAAPARGSEEDQARSTQLSAAQKEEAVLQGEQLVAPEVPAQSAQPAVTPVAQPVETPRQKVERAPLSSAYTASQASHERKTIEGDPYREQLA